MTSDENSAIPAFPGFASRMVPLLSLLWLVAVLATLLVPPLGLGGAWGGVALLLAAWATPTLLMLWPVARRKGLSYLEYRTPGFLVSVGSMAGVPLLVILLTLSPPAAGSLRIAAILAVLVVVIGLFALPAAYRGAAGRTVRMMFRPDLVLGPNRVLAGGLVAMAIGMKFMFTDMPAGDVPRGNFFAFTLLIVLGLYQLIPIRGMLKLKTRMIRMTTGRLRGFGVAAAKEAYLVAILTLMLFFAHNFFGGVTPFTMDVLMGSTSGLVLMLLSGAVLVVVRAAYKMRIGDPFFRETTGQSLLKDAILVAGLSVYLYGYLNVMGGHTAWNTGSAAYLSNIGLVLWVWAVVLLLPVRAWARAHERRGVMTQMVHVVLPSLPQDRRERAVGGLVGALSKMPDLIARRSMGMMRQSLASAPPQAREKMIAAQMQALSRLEMGDRARLMRMMDSA